MSLSRVVGFTMPVGFDVASYDEVNDRVALIANPNDPAAPWKRNSWVGYASAWKGLAFRLRSAVGYDREFGRLISLSTAETHEVRYAQERALFGCVAAALSAIECLYMATYCVATVLSPPHFPLQQAKHLNQSPSDVAKAYLSWLPTDDFSRLLSQVAGSNEFEKLAGLRNTLAHRGVLPRQHFLSTVASVPSAIPLNPKALAEDFDYSASLSDSTTSTHTRWVCQTTSQLVGAFNIFLARPR